jgi:hypothetical protein
VDPLGVAIKTYVEGGYTVTEYADGTRRTVSRAGDQAIRWPNGTSRITTAEGLETTYFPDGTSIGRGGPRPPAPTLGDMRSRGQSVTDDHSVHVYRHDGTHEQTFADGAVQVTASDGSWIWRPPPAPVVPPPGEPWTLKVTGTDGSVLEVDPYGHRTFTHPNGGPRDSLPQGRPPQPIVTHDADGTKHEHGADGTHTIIEDHHGQEIRTVIPAKPVDAFRLDEVLPRDGGMHGDWWENKMPDGSIQRTHQDGRIEVLRPDGTHVDFPSTPVAGLPPGVAPGTEQIPGQPEPTSHIQSGSVDPDGTVRRSLYPNFGLTGTERPRDLISYPDGSHIFTDKDGTVTVTDPDGQQTQFPSGTPTPSTKGISPWLAGAVGTVLVAIAAGIGTARSGDGAAVGPTKPVTSSTVVPSTSEGGVTDSVVTSDSTVTSDSAVTATEVSTTTTTTIPAAQTSPTISGVFRLTEDTAQFSPGEPDAMDPLGCARRRVPQQVTVTRIGADRINLVFPDDPGSVPIDHFGTIDAQDRFNIDYPDASGTQIEGQFVLFGSQTDIVDGRLYSGACTFVFIGTNAP